MKNTPLIIFSGICLACSPKVPVIPIAAPVSNKSVSAESTIELPADFKVLSAYIFIPQWDHAKGFSAGGKYVIQGETFNEDRERWSGGDHFFGLHEEGKTLRRFEVVGESLVSNDFEVLAVEHNGSTYDGDGTIFLIPLPVSSSNRLLRTMDDEDRPKGEANHEFGFGIDINGDAKPDYIEFVHYCKEEQAPYPMDDEARVAWETKHGKVDWDYTCSNVYSMREGQWVKGERQTPM
jgi:hypothetical protein